MPKCLRIHKGKKWTVWAILFSIHCRVPFSVNILVHTIVLTCNRTTWYRIVRYITMQLEKKTILTLFENLNWKNRKKSSWNNRNWMKQCIGTCVRFSGILANHPTLDLVRTQNKKYLPTNMCVPTICTGTLQWYFFFLSVRPLISRLVDVWSHHYCATFFFLGSIFNRH